MTLQAVAVRRYKRVAGESVQNQILYNHAHGLPLAAHCDCNTTLSRYCPLQAAHPEKFMATG